MPPLRSISFNVMCGLFATLLATTADSGAHATEFEGRGSLSQQTAELPEIVREFLFGAAEIEEPLARQALLKSIVSWLAAGFHLPDGVEQPRLAFAPSRKIAALRYHQLLEIPNAPPRGVPADGERSTVAIYVDSEHTLYLPEGWSGHTPAELSILVHELVHHLQAFSAEKFACPRAREEAAYTAQEKWLNIFGQDLAGAFEIDKFTLLVRTNCAY